MINKTNSLNEVVEINLFDEFNIDLNLYNKISKTVKQSETLGKILNDEGISYSKIDVIERALSPEYDVRQIKEGNPYHLYFTNDTNASFHHFIYEISQTEYFIITFQDSITTQVIEKEVCTKLAKGMGIITSSLWNTMKESKLDPNLAIKLSEIYAWEIDFYRIQKNDKFKIIFEKKYVGSKPIGSGKIRAAQFTSSGKDFYAFFFENDSVKDYFNQETQSLRKTFLKAPLKFSRISSGFSTSRRHPVLNTRRPHYGTDYAAPTGTPIMAVGDGVVTEARYKGGNGNYVKIRHNSVYETQYLHMSRFAHGIRPGVRVSQGDVIGYVGMTGLATGPHVCFRFWKNGQQVNHLKEEFPHAEPLDSIYHEEFFKLRDFALGMLDKMVFENE
ncbi:MAG: peptidoglycan DD-metalloendopeptidase family protein [Bacteroidales bacterium]|nr:peptidoglycan DD-metalloendopeptidase family protein [Bacteroidales bacterium]